MPDLDTATGKFQNRNDARSSLFALQQTSRADRVDPGLKDSVVERSTGGKPVRGIGALLGVRVAVPLGSTRLIVRIWQDSAGRISGVVEWVRTGEKIRFHGLAAIREVITCMVQRTRWG